MRKIVITLITLLPIIAYADNMCVKDGSVLVVLDPQINGTALSNNRTGKTWSTQFSYGIISGIGGCYSNVGDVQGRVATNQTDITPSVINEGYCYCKMLRPVESMWVYSGYKSYSTNGQQTYCELNCASYCSSNTANGVALRTGMFDNIAE